ncbi:hypothetical protein [Priestia megaterium]|uniref:hypothetical protein n=1 Tax=Priestia megaterium TaxID=1404 RepID=UPI0023DA20F2|nr:hypothetical protein [Priestia megaterium]MDF2010185.1 hypothetical protein [Priestia megaterium]
MLAKLRKRILNPKVILAVVSGILLVMVNLGIIDVEMSQHVTEAVNTILGFFITLGIFGHPESHVKEDKTE